MKRPLRALFGATAAIATLAASRPSRAAPCTEATIGMPCDVTIGNPCSGICLIDVEALPREPICVIADSATLALLGLASLDGLPCSPDGGPGRDCSHACHGLEGCVPAFARSGVGCLAHDDQETTCAASCDGQGACVEHDGGAACAPSYAATECSLDLCDPFASAGPCWHFELPSWTACEDAKGAPGTCGEAGACVAAAADAAIDATPDAAPDAEPTATPSENDGGCAFARARADSPAWVGLAALALAARRARRRARAAA